MNDTMNDTMNMNAQPAAAENEVLAWDSAIEKDTRDHVLLPEGDYNYKVTGLQHRSYEGGRTIPPCPEASLSLRVESDMGSTTVYVNLFLVRSQESRICDFFRSIGMKKFGERINMDWDHVEGKRGRFHLSQRKYTGRDGSERTTYDVRFIDWDDKYFKEEPAAFRELKGPANDDELPF